MSGLAAELSRLLAERAEVVCRHYLSNGHRSGNYWLVGDVQNTPGRSLFVRLKGPASGRGAAGRWTDAATGQHGDLLDLISLNQGLDRFADLACEARHFLAMPYMPVVSKRAYNEPDRAGSRIKRLLAKSVPLPGTPAETWLHSRGIDIIDRLDALRFHPTCRTRVDGRMKTWPAMIAAVTDPEAKLTGLMRTFLMADGAAMAPIAEPRRALGRIGGHGVRFGNPDEVMLAGEGIETVLSLRMALPDMPMTAALSAGNLGRLILPKTLRRLYLAADRDQAGRWACAKLADQARAAGIEPIRLNARLNDFNDDLLQFGLDTLRIRLRRQLDVSDIGRFLPT
ncbi:DNA primase [Chelativorans sp. ZYF759]|uniref:DUF7146 domain-containing protein n=1 Tax=Chelativorans sp. ZYF759 TaxID=2692213 RepID=UPI00145F05A1|nr:toprim domain-containing protein [Chelativorans sp. ZYF759]NMG41791.1 DNA primase [Chelativorans sp. ZYF759]